MKGRVANLAASAILVLLPTLCRAQDFSADVNYDPPKSQDASSHPVSPKASSKLYVSKDKMRLESGQLSQTIMLTDFGSHTTTLIFPGKKAYQPLASGPPQYFRVADADNACPDWQKAVGQEIACEKAGNELVAGRKTVKYRNKGAAASGSAASVWIDPSLKFVIKWEDADGGAELHNITEGPQAADLFVVPSDYEVLKPQKKGHWTSKRP
jgi:hypothetical protein